MCGIFGRFARRPGRLDIDTLCGATNLLAHRGPDDGTWWADGPFFLGHRRLSIIDLAGGTQPMFSEDGRYALTFNGEIYNYIELRDELQRLGARFRTSSDSEVLLCGYALWGRDLPTRLAGMFAFAIADRQEQSLFLARDPFGEKPLFVATTEEAVTFASELSALSALSDIDRTIDEQALGGYLCLNYVPLDRTMFKSVRRLPAASWIHATATGLAIGRYWQPPPVSARAMSEGDADAALKAALDESIRCTLRSDVPVTLFLSGGIDSSLVAESAVRQGRLTTAYSLDLTEADHSEADNAAAVAAALGIELRRVPFDSGALNQFIDCVAHADDPLADSSALAVWSLAKAVGQDYKVALTGDGGDELFAGYLTYQASSYHRQIVARLPGPARRGLARAAGLIPLGHGKVTRGYQLMRFLRSADMPTSEAHLAWNGTWLPRDAARLAAPFASSSAERALSDLVGAHAVPSDASTAALQRLDVVEYLGNDILVKVDRMTMAHGLETRAPLLFPLFAETALSLPDNDAARASRPLKWRLRRLVRQIYGNRIAAAKKQGFSIPIHRWLRGPGRPLVDRLLEPAAVRATGLLNDSAVSAAVAAHHSGRAQLGFELWGLMVLVAWHQMRVATRPALRPDGLRRVVQPLVAATSR